MNTQLSHRPSRAFHPALNAMMAALGEGIDHFDRSGYPPQNIYRTSEDDYTIEMAIAGFTADDIDITVENSTLTVATKPRDETAPENEKTYLHRGLALRDFRRSYTLGEYMAVQDATLENGLLRIHLKRELPEAAKPRQIEITSA